MAAGDTKAYFTRPDVRAKLSEQVTMWRTLKTHAATGDQHALNQALEHIHPADPNHGKAVARDVADLTRTGHLAPRTGSERRVR